MAAPRATSQPHKHKGKQPKRNLLYPDNHSAFQISVTVLNKLHKMFNTYYKTDFVLDFTQL